MWALIEIIKKLLSINSGRSKVVDVILKKNKNRKTIK